MSTTPLVSIIMPMFNAGRFVLSAIESVKHQTFSNWELIIVDDCSTDNGLEIANAYIDDRVIVLKNEINQGVVYSRNKGIDRAKGRFIAFLDSDDIWLPNKLEVQLEVFNSEPGTILVCSSYDVFSEQSDQIQIRKTRIPCSEITYDDLLKTNSIGCLTAMYDASVAGKFYMPACGHEDYALWLYILRTTKTKCLGIRQTLAMYRAGHSSLSSNKYKMAKNQWIIYRNIEGISLVRSLFLMCAYLFNGIRKR